jgi:hypothetical protein
MKITGVGHLLQLAYSCTNAAILPPGWPEQVTASARARASYRASCGGASSAALQRGLHALLADAPRASVTFLH